MQTTIPGETGYQLPAWPFVGREGGEGEGSVQAQRDSGQTCQEPTSVPFTIR